jgi:hypothetical protein
MAGLGLTGALGAPTRAHGSGLPEPAQGGSPNAASWPRRENAAAGKFDNCALGYHLQPYPRTLSIVLKPP